MAEALQRAFSLTVVKVRLGDLGGVPQVDVQLVDNSPGEQRVLEQRRFPLGWFGFAAGGTPDASRLRVHHDVSGWIGGWARRELRSDEVLWLHLVKPYGPLGAVPWEEELQPAVGVPLLRLPDALPDPERSTSDVTVALCVAVAPRKGGAGNLLRGVAEAISVGVGERLRLHVFADLPHHGPAGQLATSLPFGSCTVHRADGAASAPPSGPVVRNGWLRWMRSATSGLTLDAVHLVAHGRLVGDEGAILTTACPAAGEDRYRVELAQADELRAFLTQVGALSVGFSHPGESESDRGLRQLADELGATRAGPVVLHDARVDHGAMERLASAWAFLTAPGRASPPAHPSLMLFAQPRQVVGAGSAEGGGPDSPPVAAATGPVTEHFSRAATPRWLAASQRFIEETTAELMRLREVARERSLTDAEEDEVVGVEAALDKIRALVDAHAERAL